MKIINSKQAELFAFSCVLRLIQECSIHYTFIPKQKGMTFHSA